MASRATRLGVVIAVSAAVVAVVAGPASAHVTLHSYEAQAGGSDALIQVRVPNEESSATTTQVEVDFPADAPIIGLYVEPTPGWQFQITTSNLPKPITNDDGTFTQYVSRVVWSGGNIPVGGFVDFNIDASDLPNVPTLMVKALQTYSNGDIVRWIDPPAAPGQPDPPHPAPTLDLPAAPASGSATSTTAPLSPPSSTVGSAGPSSTAASGASNGAGPTVSRSGLATTGDVNGAKTVGIIALVAAVVGLLAAGAALLGRRRRSG